MPSLYTEIEINALKPIVWEALICKEKWLYWNTFLYDRNPQKPFAHGKKVHLSLRRVREESETEFEPRITLFQPETCLRWVYAAPGFRSESIFQLQQIDRHRTKYIHQENFSGAVTPVFLLFLRQDQQQGLRRMARELKQYVEGFR